MPHQIGSAVDPSLCSRGEISLFLFTYLQNKIENINVVTHIKSKSVETKLVTVITPHICVMNTFTHKFNIKIASRV